MHEGKDNSEECKAPEMPTWMMRWRHSVTQSFPLCRLPIITELNTSQWSDHLLGFGGILFCNSQMAWLRNNFSTRNEQIIFACDRSLHTHEDYMHFKILSSIWIWILFRNHQILYRAYICKVRIHIMMITREFFSPRIVLDMECRIHPVRQKGIWKIMRERILGNL